MSDPVQTARQLAHQFLGFVCAWPSVHSDSCDKLTAAIEADRAARDRQHEAALECLKNELRGVANDVDGECLCDDPADMCNCGGDGDSEGEPLELGCAACWARRLREVAAGVPWPPRNLTEEL